jgi:hypothetical protein
MTQMTFSEQVNSIREPYTYRRKHRNLPWWLADRLGVTFEIWYDDSPIREITNSRENVKAIVDLLNCAYKVGALDMLSTFPFDSEPNPLPSNPRPNLTIVK